MEIEEEKKIASTNFTLLVVDDQDSITQFLKDSLSETFKQVLIARDGVEALEMLHNNPIDAVVSDVMMPRMDGFELCSKIKKDLAISHIPVILLTAKTDDESMLLGYKTGADAYLPKPFDLDVLTQMILNQLKRQQLMQEKFASPGTTPLPQDATFSEADEDFMQRLNELIDRELDNPNLDVALLETEMGMSRASLFNKMKAITGMGCNEYVTKLRMEKAIQLVKWSTMTFTEIADRVGYSSASYFSSAFKQYTGMTPTQCRKEAQ